MPREAGVVVETYTYLAGSEPDASPPSWSDLKEIHGEAGSGRTCAIAEAVPENRNPLQTRQANDAESQQRFELGRRQGCEEGRKVEREAHDVVRLAEERRHKEQIVSLLRSSPQNENFTFMKSSMKWSNWPLAAAARILRRESLMDPLLLTGAVRIALGQLRILPKYVYMFRQRNRFVDRSNRASTEPAAKARCSCGRWDATG